MPATTRSPPPSPLLEFLSNDYLLRQTTPYFLPHEILSLGLASKSFHNLLFHTRGVFRHVDLSLSSIIPTSSSPKHTTLTQPITCSLRRNTPSFLSSALLGRDTTTLVLDGLPMNFDLLNNLLVSPNQRITILSVRDCAINQPVFMSTLHFLVRPGSKSSLKGVYLFNKSNGQKRAKNKWQRIGEVEFIEGWAETVLACEGKIVFDIGLCKGGKHMHFAPLEDAGGGSSGGGGGGGGNNSLDIELGSTPVSIGSGFSAFTSQWSGAGVDEASSVTSSSIGQDDNWMPPQMAPKLAVKRINGKCEGCGVPPVGCTSKLYGPVPLLTSRISVACRPRPGDAEEVDMCEDCTRERLCECCGKWWCEACYEGTAPGRLRGIANGGVLLDCYDCGRTCADCKKETLGSCKGCNNKFCRVHDEANSDVYCDWCWK